MQQMRDSQRGPSLPKLSTYTSHSQLTDYSARAGLSSPRPTAACGPGWLCVRPDTKSYTYLKPFSFLPISFCFCACTLLLPV